MIGTITATWDGEAQVWVADSDDLPGVVAEAATEAELLAKLRERVPEMLELNAHLLREPVTGIEIRWLKVQALTLAA
jgi:predicted RNase H-like HicB family nuclease